MEVRVIQTHFIRFASTTVCSEDIKGRGRAVKDKQTL